MNQTSLAYEQLIDKFSKWGEAQADIRAAMIVGSRARANHPADEWSDLDLVIITTNPKQHLSKSDWLENIGQPWITFVDRTSTGDERERRVIFEGGLDVDCAFISVRLAQAIVFLGWIQERFPRLFRPSQLQQLMQKAEGFQAMARRGTRVLLDKDGWAARLTRFNVERRPPGPPTESEFLQVVNDFWYHAVWTAKHLRRGELWWTKSACDERMKIRLRQMIEWHARSMKGWEYDTWMRGRFLEEWADSRAVEQLGNTFAHYHAGDIRRALLATMDLFRWLAKETALQLNYPYPAIADERITEWVKCCLSRMT